ncbi:MAG: NlpC/P60 family protein, partial [Balneolaceae bacterium]
MDQPSKYLNLFLIFLIFLITNACGMSGRGVLPERSSGDGAVNTMERPHVEMNSITQKLHQAHSEWAGTPYVLGGSGKNGIDCSAFTKRVLEEYFDIQIPRHTRDQLQSGSSVRRNYIRPGDLVFFRTARGVLHVGIAMEGDDFLHASVSSGVMVSSLRESYWASRYLGT